MDLLDNYKKAWKNQPEEASKPSSVEIYKLAQSKSSSIVKWIFIIGLLEFVVLNSFYFFIDIDKSYAGYKKLGLVNFIFYSQIVAYTVLFYFLAIFYLNYKRISATDSTSNLMKKIIKTRKTVKNYVLFNLGYLLLVMIVVTNASIQKNLEDVSNKEILLIVFAALIATLLILGILCLFYQLLYGFLLKKLNRNYKELAKLDSKD
jgi:hypothetical protein